MANAAFWVDDARPVSHIRLRYNGLFDVEHPDRAEYYVGNDNDIINNNDQKLRAVADINEFRLYSETAIGQTFGIFIDLPWRDYDQVQSNGEFGDTGFGDMIVGTKSVLLDSEIWVVSFQFSTFIPTGAGDFLGTRHVSLEPSILTYTKMSRDCYVQFQSAFWIPLGGLQTGNVWHNRLSVNYVLCRILPDVPLIGTLEFVNYNVLTGGFDDNGVTGDGTGAYFGVGPGLRLDVCERIDVGVGSMFSLTDDFFESQGVRVDFRWRF
ncbi:MAG: transporter [Gemmataceae bacterium]